MWGIGGGGCGRIVVGVSFQDIESGEHGAEIYKISPDLTSKTKISPDGFGEGAMDFDLETNSQGRTLAAWEVEEDDNSISVYGQFFDGDGPDGTPFLIHTSEVFGSLLAAVALDDAGYGTVVTGDEYIGAPGTVVFRTTPGGDSDSVVIPASFLAFPFGLFTVHRDSFLSPVAGGKVLIALLGETLTVEPRSGHT